MVRDFHGTITIIDVMGIVCACFNLTLTGNSEADGWEQLWDVPTDGKLNLNGYCS